MDALYKLFAEDSVVLLKMNPVNEYMGPILESALSPLRQDGFLEIVYGEAIWAAISASIPWSILFTLRDLITPMTRSFGNSRRTEPA